MARKRQSADKNMQDSKSETGSNQLVNYVKTISDKVTDISKSSTNANSIRKFAEFAKIVYKQLSVGHVNRQLTISPRMLNSYKMDLLASDNKTDYRNEKNVGRKNNKNFEIEVVRLLNQIKTSINKNNVPDFLEKRLSGILHETHIKNAVWDENRADNRTPVQSKSGKETLNVIKETISDKKSKNENKQDNNDKDDNDSGGLISGLINGATGLGAAAISALATGSMVLGGAIFHGTGGENPTLAQSTARTGIKVGMKYAAKKLSNLAPKLFAKRISALRTLAKDPATKIIRSTTKNASKALSKSGIFKRVASPSIKAAATRAAKLAGVAKAAQKVGLKGVLKAGKLAKSAKFLGTATKIAKFGGKKLIPGVGLVLGGMEAAGHFKNGNYLRGATSLGSGILSTIPGLGTAVSVGLDALGLVADVGGWAAKKKAEVKEKRRQARASGQNPELTFGDKVGEKVGNILGGNILPKSIMKTQTGRAINDILDTGLRVYNPIYNFARHGYNFNEDKIADEKIKERRMNIQKSASPSIKQTPLGEISISATSGADTPTTTTKPSEEEYSTKPGSTESKPDVNTFGSPETHNKAPHISLPEHKPKMERPQIPQNQGGANINSVITDEMKKSRDAGEMQSKQITQSFKEELEKVYGVLAQINATLPALQPTPPPPVQQIMEGNKVPEFRKHNLEAIA